MSLGKWKKKGLPKEKFISGDRHYAEEDIKCTGKSEFFLLMMTSLLRYYFRYGEFLHLIRSQISFAKRLFDVIWCIIYLSYYTLMCLYNLMFFCTEDGSLPKLVYKILKSCFY